MSLSGPRLKHKRRQLFSPKKPSIGPTADKPPEFSIQQSARCPIDPLNCVCRKLLHIALAKLCGLNDAFRNDFPDGLFGTI